MYWDSLDITSDSAQLGKSAAFVQCPKSWYACIYNPNMSIQNAQCAAANLTTAIEAARVAVVNVQNAANALTAADAARDYNSAKKPYLEMNEDVAAANLHPWDHFVTYGRNEGRTWPGEEGKGSDRANQLYLEQNPDVARANMPPWYHYVSYGRREGRVWPGIE